MISYKKRISDFVCSGRSGRLSLIAVCLFALVQASCSTQRQQYTAGPDLPPRAVVRDGVAITLRDQKLTVFRGGKKVKDYSISSSKFGIGSRNGSNRTPLGIHAVTRKVGDGQPKGMVFKACRPTGEVVPADASGRDPIVTRVIQIAGLEGFNSNSHSRRIYIHGTPEERKIGRPASYGCIRMRSNDVLDLYSRVYRGMPVAIEKCSQEAYLQAEQDRNARGISIPQSIVANLPTDREIVKPVRSLRKRSLARRSRLAKRGRHVGRSRSSASRRSATASRRSSSAGRRSSARKGKGRAHRRALASRHSRKRRR